MNEAQVFVVRVWRQADAFRASVQAAGEEPSRLFTQPQQLAGFLADVVGTPAPPHDDPGGPDDHHP